MTTLVQKHSIQPKWSIGELRREATRMVASSIVARIKMMEKAPAGQVNKFVKSSAKEKASFFKACGVQSPLDLVKFLAEHEVNMFGSRAKISGDEDSAFVINEWPRVWLEAKRLAPMNHKQEQMMIHQYETWMQELGKTFGFTTKVQITKKGCGSTITFSRKKGNWLTQLLSPPAGFAKQ